MKITSLNLALWGLAASSAHAEPYLGNFDDIVVTATRTAETADTSLRPVIVITRRDIEHSQAHDLLDLLARRTGINIGRTGGEGKGASVYMRGTFAKHVLVLVDGVRAASSTTGEYDWNALSPEQIERIEIVLGPRASLYGSDALGGVVQIFTRQAPAPLVRATLGSHGTRAVNASLGGGSAWRYSLSAGHYLTDGIPNFRDEQRSYGFYRNQAGLSLEGAPARDVSLAFRVNQSWGQNENDATTGDNDYTNRIASLRLVHQGGAQWRQSLVLGNALDSYTSYSPYTPARIETNRRSLSWQHDLDLGGGLLSLGVDHWNDQASKDRSGAIDQRIENTGLFLQYQLWAAGNDWQLGARRDRHDVFGGQNTWNLSWGRDLGGGLRLLASHATAFKAPSVNDFYWPMSTSFSGVYDFGGTYFSDTYVTQGNPALRPETSRGTEIGLRYRREALHMEANLYQTRIQDLIEWTSDVIPGGGTGTAGNPILTTYNWYPQNISSARIRGLELSAGTRLGGWELQGTYTRLLASNLRTDRQLDRRPGNSLSLRAERAYGPHRLSIEAEGYSPRNDSSASTTLPGYGLLHLGYEQMLGKGLTLGVRLENALDKEYALARIPTRFYATPGRGLFVSLNWRPG